MSETLLGVILGGFIAGACGIITASMQYFFESKKYKREKLDEINASNIRKKEIIYSKYMNLKSILIGLQYGLSKAENKEDYSKDFDMLWGEELRSQWSKAFENAANLSLHAKIDIARRCHEFTYKYQNINEQNFMEVSTEIDEIVTLMRKDLGVD